MKLLFEFVQKEILYPKSFSMLCNQSSKNPVFLIHTHYEINSTWPQCSLSFFFFFFWTEASKGLDKPLPVKWISKWRGNRTLESIAGQHGCLTRRVFNSRRSRTDEIVTFWPWRQPFNSFCFETIYFFLCFPFFFLLLKKWVKRGSPSWKDGVATKKC